MLESEGAGRYEGHLPETEGPNRLLRLLIDIVSVSEALGFDLSGVIKPFTSYSVRLMHRARSQRNELLLLFDSLHSLFWSCVVFVFYIHCHSTVFGTLVFVLIARVVLVLHHDCNNIQ